MARVPERIHAAARQRLAGTGLALGCLVAAGLVVACARPDSDSPSESPHLRFEAERVVLGPVWSLDGPGDSARLVDAGLDDTAEVEAAFGVFRSSTLGAGGACAHSESLPPLLGRFRRSGRDLVYEPRFGWIPGERYSACVDLVRLARLFPGGFAVGCCNDAQGSVLTVTFVAPATVLDRHQPYPEALRPGAPVVSAVWPDTEVVPENLLRFYLRFSEPMTRQGVSEHIDLVSDNGATIADAFVEIPNGLWDERATRLTLFLHPGRIKRRVGPHQRQGPVLRSGATYTLRVDGDLRSARGTPIGAVHRHSFAVGPADRELPDPNRWSIEAPSDLRGAVTLRFDEILDVEQLATFGWIEEGETRADGQAVIPGRAVPGPEGRSWSFHPTDPWLNQSYRIITRRSIEDLAGNTTDRLFEVDTSADPDAAAGRAQAWRSEDRGGTRDFLFVIEAAGR